MTRFEETAPAGIGKTATSRLMRTGTRIESLICAPERVDFYKGTLKKEAQYKGTYSKCRFSSGHFNQREKFPPDCCPIETIHDHPSGFVADADTQLVRTE